MPKQNATVSQMDKDHYLIIRSSVDNFLASQASSLDKEGIRLLDIAPQDHKGAAPFFPKATIETFDLDPQSGCKYIGDITKENPSIPSGHFDVIICTEVLEHTLQPFGAAQELHRILKPGGTLLVTTPFNFRIHGPLPDCWRFTEYGLQALLSGFSSVTITESDTPERELMPVHYQTVAVK